MQNQTLFQIQDTVPQSNTTLGNELNIERNVIELVQLRSLTVDSARLVPKKMIQVVKTVPFVPQGDTILHPAYQVLTQNFIFPEQPGFFDPFNITPLNPNDRETVFFAKSAKLPIVDTADTITQTQQVQDSGPNYIAKTKGSHGFGNADWMLGIVVFSFILFGWLRVGYTKFFQMAIQATYNYFVSRRIMEEANVTRSRVFHFMNLLFFINLALFLTQWFVYNKIEIFNIQGILLFFIFFALVIVVYAIKAFFLYLLDFLFLAGGGFSSYIFTTFLYNKMVGFILLPVIAILPYVPDNITPWLFYASFLSIAVLYVFRIFRGLQIGFKNRLSIFYLILYLCALEILPVLIVIKVISSYL